jgi:hypothetical protein
MLHCNLFELLKNRKIDPTKSAECFKEMQRLDEVIFKSSSPDSPKKSESSSSKTETSQIPIEKNLQDLQVLEYSNGNYSYLGSANYDEVKKEVDAAIKKSEQDLLRKSNLTIKSNTICKTTAQEKEDEMSGIDTIDNEDDSDDQECNHDVSDDDDDNDDDDDDDQTVATSKSSISSKSNESNVTSASMKSFYGKRASDHDLKMEALSQPFHEVTRSCKCCVPCIEKLKFSQVIVYYDLHILIKSCTTTSLLHK